MNITEGNAFVFSGKYRLLRHCIFWLVHILIFSFLFKTPDQSYWQMHVLSALWVPAFILYAYPVMYWIVPEFLLKERYFSFSLILTLWAMAGYVLNYFFRLHILFPAFDLFNYKVGQRNPWATNSYLSMNVMAGFGCMIVLFKYWIVKQKEFLLAEKEKVNAELQLLKAQVHPHFLFNTLNNIYSFSLENSPKTPQMILKLSSLLSYMLYDCRAGGVLLAKEIEVMKNYIDLERERYGNKLEVSLNFEGDIEGHFIAPLLLLPFLENAFKHGTSEQLEKPWLGLDVAVKQNVLRVKIANSKNEMALPSEKGIGIQNVKKRLVYLYPGRHVLKLNDEGDFFVVSLTLELRPLTERFPDKLESFIA
jgi:sensor histidine kinase YesM